MDTQELVLTIYPPFHTYEDAETWRVQAYIFGEWAVHEVHPTDRQARELGLRWEISHIPSGSIAYIAHDLDPLLEAARRLLEYTLPDMRAYRGEDGSPKLPLPPPTFVRKSNERLADLDIYTVAGGYLTRPADVWPKYKRVLKRRAKSMA